MMTIPDAPWIRKAETEGTGDPPPVKCPCCGEECTTVYLDDGGDVFACNWCVEEKDAYEWFEEQREAERDDFLEHNRID